MNTLNDSLGFEPLVPLNYDHGPKEVEGHQAASAAPGAVSDTCYRLELLSGAAAAGGTGFSTSFSGTEKYDDLETHLTPANPSQTVEGASRRKSRVSHPADMHLPVRVLPHGNSSSSSMVSSTHIKQGNSSAECWYSCSHDYNFFQRKHQIII